MILCEPTHLLKATVIGVRAAALLYALGYLVTWRRLPVAASTAEWYRNASRLLFGASVVFGPTPQLFILLDHPLPRAAGYILNIIGATSMCGCILLYFAMRGLEQGLSLARVQRGIYANIAVICGLVGAAWILE